MAPRKRISKIQTRIVAPEVVSSDGSTRSIAIQTDPHVADRVEPLPTKRQKIMEKIKQLSKAKLGKSKLSKELPDSASSFAKPNPKIIPYPKAFVPSANEKACQVEVNELSEGGTLFRLNDKFENKMDYLKNIVEMRRAESASWDRDRLCSLYFKIHSNPPPRWAEASEMWLEVDQLLARVFAYHGEDLSQNMKKP